MKLGSDIRTHFLKFKNNFKDIWKIKETIFQGFISFLMMS